MGINSLMQIGNSALMANQTAINVTGNNIANVNTDGYSRQSVRFDELQPLNFRPGQLGQGVRVAEIYRNFDRFVENAYLDKFSQYSRWNEQSTVLQTVESLFNESNRSGISSTLGKFFTDWSDLTKRPDDMASREALLANAETLSNMLNSTRNSLTNMQNEMDLYIDQGVREVNELLQSIQNINKQIASEYVPGVNNVNTLLDARDQKVRELSELIDVEVQDRGVNDFTIRTKSGLPLLDANTLFSLELSGPRIENNLAIGSAYKGTMDVVGSDSHEYTFEVVTPPSDVPIPNGSKGELRVSLDGGRTWLRNDDGSEFHAPIPTAPNETIKVKDLEVSFSADPTKLSKGDRFEVIPKTGLYWNSPTRAPLNVTPQMLNDGTDNASRISGGKLAAYFNTRDNYCGRYIDKLDAFSEALVWEVNSLHSQGAGTKPMTHALGTYSVGDFTRALGSDQSGLVFNDKLTSGNLSFQIFDANGKPLPKGTPPAGIPQSLDFDTATPGIQNFDPSKHSLNDLVSAINDPNAGYGAWMQANIVDGKLQLTSIGNTSFAAAADSTGLLAGLGINTFFQGSNAADISINAIVRQDPTRLNAGRVNANGEITSGDNSMAEDMFKLATKTVPISTTWENSRQSLGGYYGSLVGLVGAEVRTSKVNTDYNQALTSDLETRSASISGVNLDEEMTSLIKFQHSYTAAAKLITTADQMMQILLGLKQ